MGFTHENRGAARVRAAGARHALACMFLFLSAAVADLATNAAHAQDGADSTEVRNCVDLMRIDHTDVIDNDTLLFHMRGGAICRNDLPNSCPTLERTRDRDGARDERRNDR